MVHSPQKVLFPDTSHTGAGIVLQLHPTVPVKTEQGVLPAFPQEHIRSSLELSCLKQCLDLQQRLAMAQGAISQLTGPIDFSTQPASPAPRSPKAATGKPCSIWQLRHVLLTQLACKPVLAV